MATKIYSLYRLEGDKRKHYRYFTGENLWKAIFDSGYSCYTPAIIDDWYDQAQKQYQDDWELKQDFLPNICSSMLIEEMLDNLEIEYNEQMINELQPFLEGFYSFNCYYLMTKQFKLSKLANPIKFNIQFDSFKIYLKEKKFKEIINKIYDHYDNKFVEWCYQRSYDDFDCCISDIDKDNDTEVANFFGYEQEITGYEIDWKEYDLKELYICPSCNEPLTKDRLKDAYEYYETTDGYTCYECGAEYDWNSQAFMEANKHISEEEIIARLI